MNYLFDLYGWYAGTSEVVVPRSTTSIPPNLSLTATQGENRANWTGHTWIDKPYVTPVPPPAPVPQANDPEWFIDIGAFYDRFGAEKMNVLTSSNVVVQAIIKDVSVRKWIDLNRVDVAMALAAIGSIVTSVTPLMQTTILTTPVADHENLALRKVYFS